MVCLLFLLKLCCIVVGPPRYVRWCHHILNLKPTNTYAPEHTDRRQHVYVFSPPALRSDVYHITYLSHVVRLITQTRPPNTLYCPLPPISKRYKTFIHTWSLHGNPAARRGCFIVVVYRQYRKYRTRKVILPGTKQVSSPAIYDGFL